MAEGNPPQAGDLSRLTGFRRRPARGKSRVLSSGQSGPDSGEDNAVRVLVIDDAPEQRLIVTRWLEQLGHDVVAVSDGASGIVAFEASRPDLILLDVVMAGLDGLETARRIRALDGPWVPIIFISGNAEPQAIGEAIDAGGDDYLIKPVNKVVLTAKLMAMQRIVAIKTVMASALPDHVAQQLRRLAEIDAGTGLANRHGLDRGLAREYARCARAARPISAIVAQTEERHDAIAQHDAEPLTHKLAAAFKSHVRRSPDLLAYPGDGRFYAILPDTPLTGALHLTGQITQTIAELHRTAANENILVRFGVATQVPESGRDYAALVDTAEAALRQAQQDQTICVSSGEAPFRLTPRELECLQWCALGKSTWEIAQVLAISEAAVNFHMTNVRNKCGVHSRRQAIAKAIRHGLIRQE